MTYFERRKVGLGMTVVHMERNFLDQGLEALCCEKSLEKSGLERTAPRKKKADGDLAESIKRRASDQLDDLVP